MFWTQGAKVSEESLAPPKPCFATVQLSFAPVQADFGALGPKDLLHPLLATLGTFEVLGSCSRHSGSQPFRRVRPLRAHLTLQEKPSPRSSLGGRFGYFLFFLLGGGGRGSPGDGEGGGGRFFD